MSTPASDRDREARTMTFTLEIEADAESVWQLWSDPCRIERWWGPPMWPATFVEHEVVPGGRTHYFMTGPDGEQPHSWWKTLEVDEPRRLVFEQGFADEAGTPTDRQDAMQMMVTLERLSETRSLLTTVAAFRDLEQFDRISAMGMVEGMTGAMGQMEGVLWS